MKITCDVNREIGMLMRAMRTASGTTQQDMAKVLGVSRAQIANMELQRRQFNVYLHHLVNCADHCGFTVTLKVTKKRKSP